MDAGVFGLRRLSNVMRNVKQIFKPYVTFLLRYHVIRAIYNRYCYLTIKKYLNENFFDIKKFNYYEFRENILSYLTTVKYDNNDSVLYKFCTKSNIADLYSTTYAFMLKGLFGAITEDEIIQGTKYFQSCQTKDGLFRDPILQSTYAETGDNWGWRHLAPHILIVLEYMNTKPKYDFNFIFKIFDKSGVEHWLNNLNWQSDYGNICNTIMNIGVLLQYSRDKFDNQKASIYIERMYEWLFQNKIDKNTGLLGNNESKGKSSIHSKINGTYHLFTLLFYDQINISFIKNTVISVLNNQNYIGGFGPNLISNACDDIDSLYILSKYFCEDIYLKERVVNSITKSLKWIITNQNQDFGFVFKRNKPFVYGGQHILSSLKNESNLFATWFRTLSIAYGINYLNLEHDFKFSTAPGYQF